MSNFIVFLWAPIIIYFIISKNNRVPKYLIFLILFTLYHLFSVFFFDLRPEGVGWTDFFRSDVNLHACLALFVIENIRYEEWFIRRMNRNVLIVVIISLLVSLIQLTDPMFFFNTSLDTEMEYVGDNRIFSIYSWTNLNSLGITFPIYIAVLLSDIDIRKTALPIAVVAGIIVAFLSKARFVMISTIIAFSQLIISSSISLKRKISFVFLFFISILALFAIANSSGYNIQDVINDRILEKSSDVEMGSALARVTSLYVFLNKFPEHPWVGVGPKTRDDVVQLLGGEAPLIHVGYLSYLYFYGLAGALLLFCSLFFMLKRAWKVGKQSNFWGSFYGIIAFCLANVTFVYFNLSEAGIIVALIYIRYFLDEKSEQENNSEEDVDLIQDSQ